MRGSLTLIRPQVWRLRVYVGTNANRSPVQRSRTFHGGKRAAQSALAAFVAEVETAELGRGPVTVAHLLDRWLEHIGPQRRPYTVHNYRAKIEGRLKPAFGAMHLDRLTAEQMDRRYRAWLEQGLSPTTVRQCHAILAAALHQGTKWGWLERSPALRASPPSPSRERPAIPSAEEMRAILVAAAGDQVLAVAIMLAALTGARRGELCALRWSDLDEDTLTVARSLTVIGATVLEGPTKTHQIRRVSLDPVGVALLEGRRAAQANVAAVAGVALAADPFVLSRDATGDRPCLPDGLTHGFSRLCRQLGYPYHFHQLRHFAATTAIGAGVDARTVAGRLGHADASVTLRIYARALAAQDRVAADAISRALAPPTT